MAGIPWKLKAALALVVVAALGSVAAVLSIGGNLREEAVADASHEHGLRYSRDRAVASARGLRAAFDPATLRPGGQRLDFSLVDRAGAPVDGVVVRVSIHRPAGGGQARQAEARALGQGRYQAALGFDAPGYWDVRLDLSGAESIGLVQQVKVDGAATPGCDLAAAPCRASAGRLALTLDVGDDLRTMRVLPLAVEVRRGGALEDGAAVEISFTMRDMVMGENRVVLQPAGPGRWAGKGFLVRCASGRKDWVATVTVRPRGGGSESARFEFAVKE